MQQLKAKLKNTPKDASQVLCSVNPELNRVEKLSVQDKVLTFNNPDVNQHQQHTGGLKDVVYVFVLNINRMPLMPCSSVKARHLIKSKKAKIKKLFPFTIQLLFECENVTQDLTLGVDTGLNTLVFQLFQLKMKFYR